MARRGKFGRTGTTQNLSMLVYQLLKEQMKSELDSLLSSYKTNMQDGKYTSQFNGQNVDGQFVIDYYQSMLNGFPAGSTEYETLKSQLEEFKQTNQSNIQNLVIDALNNGTKVDFGLLGADFANKGIAEVELSDVRQWADQAVADMLANGDTTRADKLKGAVFIAGFNVENDGKSAAVTDGSLSYGAYAKWLSGQMQASLDSGLTKDSEAYRAIMKEHAQAIKSAKVDGQNRNYDSARKLIADTMSGVEAAAKAIIDSYDGPAKADLAAFMAQLPQTSTPYYTLMQNIASKRNTQDYGNLYGEVMGQVASGKLDELFAEAVNETNTKLNDLKDGKFGDLTPDQLKDVNTTILNAHGSGIKFVADSGIEFTTGAAANVMNDMKYKLDNSGMSLEPDQAGNMIGRGGHPDAVLAAFQSIAPYLASSKNNTYEYLNDMAKGELGVYYLGGPDSVLGSFDGLVGPKDGKVSSEEFTAGFSSGKYTHAALENAMTGMVNVLQNEQIPGSNMSPVTLVQGFVDAQWGKYAISQGSIVVVNSFGITSVSDLGDTNVGNGNFMPYIIPGTNNTVYIEGSPVRQVTEDGLAPLDNTRTGGIDIAVFHAPGNQTNIKGLESDGVVRLTGNFTDASGSTSLQTFNLSMDDFQNAARQFGVEFDASTFNNPTKDGDGSFKISFDMQDADAKTFWTNMFNPSHPYSLQNLTVRDKTDKNYGKKVLNNFNIEDHRDPGFLNSQSDVNKFLSSALADRAKITSEAMRIATNRGKKEFDQADLLDAVLGAKISTTNLSYTLTKDAISKNPAWLKALQTDYSTVKPAATSQNPLTSGAPVVASASGVKTLGGQVPFFTQQSNEDKWRNMIPGLVPSSGKAGAEPFISNVFRKSPNMVPPSPAVPAAGASGIKAGSIPAVKPTTVQPVKPVTPAKPAVSAAGVNGTSSNANAGFKIGGR